jgi:hypothetical protein
MCSNQRRNKFFLNRGRPRLEGISIEGHKGVEYGTQLERTGWLMTTRRLWTNWWSTCFPSERIIVEAVVLSLHQEWKTQTKALSRWDQSDDWSSRGYLPAIPFNPFVPYSQEHHFLLRCRWLTLHQSGWVQGRSTRLSLLFPVSHVMNINKSRGWLRESERALDTIINHYN